MMEIIVLLYVYPLPETCGGVLTALNGWHRDPFAHRPDMVGQARRHRRRPFAAIALRSSRSSSVRTGQQKL